jgi:hypothetical protein
MSGNGRYSNYNDYLVDPIYRIMRRIALRRSNNQCIDCREPATEADHLRYPKPNHVAYDTPGNMEGVCHACHCKRERKRGKSIKEDRIASTGVPSPKPKASGAA